MIYNKNCSSSHIVNLINSIIISPQMHSLKKILAIIACFTLSAVAAAAQAVSFEVVAADTGLPLNTKTTLKAGVPFDVKVRVLDQNGTTVSDYSGPVLLTLQAEANQQTYTTGFAVAGEIPSISVLPQHSATARTELDGNKFPFEVGMRFKVTDGNITTDNASGFFSIAPNRFALTYSGSDKSIATNKLTAARSYLGRITAYNLDGTVASGYRGFVSYGLTPVTSFDSITVTNPGGGYSLTTPPVVTIVNAPGDIGSGAIATATVGGVISVVSIEVTNGGSGYTTAPKVTISGGGTGARGATAVAVIADGKVTEVNITNGGSGYDPTQVNLPVVAIDPPPAAATGQPANVPATAKVASLGGQVVSISLDNPGTGYLETPTIIIEEPPLGGLGQAQASMVTTRENAFILTGVNLLNGGSGYDPANPPVVTFVGGGLGSGALASVVIDPTTGEITSISLDDPGQNYTELPSVVITDPTGLGSGAIATAEIALAGTSQSAKITFGGIVDDVRITMGAPEFNLSYNITDGVTASVGASALFNIGTEGGGALLSVDSVFFRAGGTQAGQATILNYRLLNNTSPAVTVAGPIDTQFNLLNSNNVTVLSWSEQSRTGSINSGANSGNLATSFVLPFNLTPGTYTLEILPGYAGLNRATIPVVIANPPDLLIRTFDYATGEYRGGDAFRFDMTWLNNDTNGETSALSSAVAADQKYMIEIHLSVNPTYGDSDDFLIWQETFIGNNSDGRLLPGQLREISRNVKLPENLEGTYYLFARINSSGGVNGSGVQPEFLPGAITDGNNTTQPSESQKITILPKQATNTFRVSLSSTDTQASALNDNSSLSRDGQYVVFESMSQLDSGAVRANTNNIYVRNISGNTIQLVSVGVGGAAANGNSANPEISANGRFIVFQSSASNLVPGDTNNVSDIFVRDLELGITRRLSVNPITKVQANNGSQLPSISEDGKYVVFESLATNLSPTSITGGSAGLTHIYLFNRDVDGDLIMDEVDFVESILVTKVNGQIATRSSSRPRISADGNYVAFVTTDRDILGLSQASPFSHIVRWDRNNPNIFLTVSRSKNITSGLWDSVVLGNNESGFPAINRNGSFVAFASRAKNLTSDNYALSTSSFPHVFRAEINGGSVASIIRLNSVKNPLVQTEPDNPLSILDLGSFEPSISDDGTLVTFATESADLLAPISVKNVDRTYFKSLYVYNYRDANDAADVYLYDLTDSANPLVSRASVSRFGYEATTWTVEAGFVNQRIPVSRRPVISGDGRFVSFTSDAKGHSGLIFGPTNFDYTATNDARDIYVYDRNAGLPIYTNLPQASLLPLTVNQLNAGQTFTFVANASSPVRAIASVEFYANGSLIGTASSPSAENVNRYSVQWIAPTPGAGNNNAIIYEIAVMAVDSNGARSVLSTAERVTVKQVVGIIPSVMITNPAVVTTDNTTTPAAPINLKVGSSIPVVARVTNGGSAVSSVKFYATSSSAGTVLLGNATGLGAGVYALDYTVALNPGAYGLTALAEDTSGNLIQSPSTAISVSSSSVAVPSVSLSTPAPANISIGQSTTLSAVASASIGATIAKVDFFANGILIGSDLDAPYSVNYTPVSSGAYVLQAVASDSLGNSSSSNTQSLTAIPVVGVAPVVAIQAPTTTFTTSGVYSFRATATDSDGSVTSVQFFVNGASVGSGSYISSSGTWISPLTNFSVLGAGTHVLTATATDNSGNRSNSAPLDIVVTTSTVDGVFGASLNELFYASIGRNATDAEQQIYFSQFGSSSEDYEIAAALMQTSAFDSTGAVVISAYQAVFGEYPTFAAYQDGLAFINAGGTTAAYIDSLYASGGYLAKFGALPSFSTSSNIEKFAVTVHANLTGVIPSAKIKGTALTASDLNLTAAQLAEARKTGSSERSIIVARFSTLGTNTAGSVVASYILSLTGTTENPAALLKRARVAGVILALTEPDTTISLRETSVLSAYNLLDVAGVYIGGSRI
jgi:hypothetical protein